MLPLFIINQSAGRNGKLGNWGRLRPKIEKSMSKFDFILCNNAQDFRQIAIQEMEHGRQDIFAVGGDGTFSLLANLVVEKKYHNICRIACLPGGTGSDIFRDISCGRSIEEYLKKGAYRKTDMVRVTINGKKLIYAINSISLGLPASVIQKRSALSSLVPNWLSYLVPTIQVLNSWTCESMQFTIDDKQYEKPIMAIFLMKGLFAGGGMRLGKENFRNSGKIAIALVPDVNILKFIRELKNLYFRGIHQVSFIESLDCQSFSTKNILGSKLEIDGEFYEYSSLEITLEKKVVDILCLN